MVVRLSPDPVEVVFTVERTGVRWARRSAETMISPAVTAPRGVGLNRRVPYKTASRPIKSWLVTGESVAARASSSSGPGVGTWPTLGGTRRLRIFQPVRPDKPLGGRAGSGGELSRPGYDQGVVVGHRPCLLAAREQPDGELGRVVQAQARAGQHGLAVATNRLADEGPALIDQHAGGEQPDDGVQITSVECLEVADLQVSQFGFRLQPCSNTLASLNPTPKAR